MKLKAVVCVCVCVFLPIHSGHQWTYQPGVTQEEGVVRRLGGGGDVTNLAHFWEGKTIKQSLTETYSANPQVKWVEIEASLPTM